MIIKVDWFPRQNSSGEVPPRMSHTYEADNFFSEYSWEASDTTKLQSYPTLRLILKNGQAEHDLCLSGGDTAYVMNNEGKTIEILRTNTNL